VQESEYSLIESCKAVSKEGQVFRILIYQENSIVHTFNGFKRVKGPQIAKTIDGCTCNMIGDDIFEIVELGLIVKRVD
jgi:hypothetical protein